MWVRLNRAPHKEYKGVLRPTVESMDRALAYPRRVAEETDNE